MRASRATALGLTVCLLASAWTLVCLYVVHSALPFNVVHLPYEHQLDIAMWAPQGWAFFTKSPRDDRLFLFRQVNGRWSDVSRAPDSSPANLFGLNRAARAQGVEAGLLQVSVQHPAAWADCRSSFQDCLRQRQPSVTVRNPSPDPTLCGAIALIYQPPVPWAWLTLGRHIFMPARILELNSQC